MVSGIAAANASTRSGVNAAPTAVSVRSPRRRDVTPRSCLSRCRKTGVGSVTHVTRPDATSSASRRTSFASSSEMIRTGRLDFELLKPLDEQFLLTCQRIDWALVPQVLLGLFLTAYAGLRADFTLGPMRVVIYFLLLVAGVAILYSLLVTLSATSVWTVRSEELYELWFYLLQFGNYPDDVYRTNLAGKCVGMLLTYVFPILLAVNVPARYGARLLNHWQPVAWLGAGAIISLVVSRRLFQFALRSYQSASS